MCSGKKTLQAVIYFYSIIHFFYFYYYYYFLLLDNSIAYMFIHTAHAYAHILLHKIDGSKGNVLKGTVKGQYRLPCRRTQDCDCDTGWHGAVDNVSD